MLLAEARTGGLPSAVVISPRAQEVSLPWSLYCSVLHCTTTSLAPSYHHIDDNHMSLALPVAYNPCAASVAAGAAAPPKLTIATAATTAGTATCPDSDGGASGCRGLRSTAAVAAAPIGHLIRAELPGGWLGCWAEHSC